MESIQQVDFGIKVVGTTFGLFVVAALLEIGGGYLVWLWLRERKTVALGVIGGIILFIYGIIPTLQPSNFGRVYSAYGGIFVVMAIIWGLLIERKRPDRYEIIGGTIVLVGATIIFYAPR
ncbi:MAG TPA: YnfA family protein [Candidatus Nitrosocosmicus sp.]|nr:YnfA family protein [Candidatus Nitrosocosmicus sp.]